MMQEMTPLQRYLLQRRLAGGGVGPSGQGGMPSNPVGPGIADPFTGGAQGAPMTNPMSGEDEFGLNQEQMLDEMQRRQALKTTRPYLGGY